MKHATQVEMTIEGPCAQAAVGELLTRRLLEGRVSQLDGVHPDADTVAVCVQILSITSDAMTVADKLLSWWEKWHESGTDQAHLAVLVKADGVRLPINGMKAGEIAAILKRLPQRSA
jgi:hypothetical protein